MDNATQHAPETRVLDLNTHQFGSNDNWNGITGISQEEKDALIAKIKEVSAQGGDGHPYDAIKEVINGSNTKQILWLACRQINNLL